VKNSYLLEGWVPLHSPSFTSWEALFWNWAIHKDLTKERLEKRRPNLHRQGIRFSDGVNGIHALHSLILLRNGPQVHFKCYVNPHRNENIKGFNKNENNKDDYFFQTLKQSSEHFSNIRYWYQILNNRQIPRFSVTQVKQSAAFTSQQI
jgi:hypothetical protein